MCFFIIIIIIIKFFFEWLSLCSLCMHVWYFLWLLSYFLWFKTKATVYPNQTGIPDNVRLKVSEDFHDSSQGIDQSDGSTTYNHMQYSASSIQ